MGLSIGSMLAPSTWVVKEEGLKLGFLSWTDNKSEPKLVIHMEPMDNPIWGCILQLIYFSDGPIYQYWLVRYNNAFAYVN